MKILNKFIWSKKEPSNKNDIWFDGSTWRMYTEEAWQSFTLPIDAADKVAKVIENASQVYQEKLNAGYGIIIEGNTISVDDSDVWEAIEVLQQNKVEQIQLNDYVPLDRYVSTSQVLMDNISELASIKLDKADVATINGQSLTEGGNIVIEENSKIILDSEKLGEPIEGDEEGMEMIYSKEQFENAVGMSMSEFIEKIKTSELVLIDGVSGMNSYYVVADEYTWTGYYKIPGLLNSVLTVDATPSEEKMFVGVYDEAADLPFARTEYVDEKHAQTETKLAELSAEIEDIGRLFDSLPLEIGSISADNGKDTNLATRFRTIGLVSAPFSVTMSSGYNVQYIFRYTPQGDYVDYLSPPSSSSYATEDNNYRYRLSFKKGWNNETITDNDLDVALTYKGVFADIPQSVSDLKRDVANIDEITSSLKSEQLVVASYEKQLDAVYLGADGNLVTANSFFVRLYDVRNCSAVKIEGTGGGAATRYAFYRSEELNATNALAIGPVMSGTDYSEIISAPSNAEYLAVTYRTTWQQTISLLVVSDAIALTQKKSLKVLCLGNSFTLGSFGYAPFFIKKNYEDVDLTIGIAFISGGTLGPTYDGVENHYQKLVDDSSYIYWKYENNASAWKSVSATPSEMLADEEWDIITLQQGSNNAPNYDTYQPYLDNIIELLSQKVSKPIMVGWVTPHADSYVLSSGKENDIMECSKRVMDETIIQTIIPYGKAIANARATDLSQLGDAENLLYEGKHLQNGIGQIVANYCTMLWLLDKMGMNNKSIVGMTSLEVTDSWIASHNIPNASAVGGCVGVTEENCRIAAQCAIKANKKPYNL